MIWAALEFLGYTCLAFGFCFLYYIAVMELHRVKGRNWYVKILALIFLVFVDAPVNIFVMTTWFLELPREWLVTTRLKRWRIQYTGSNYTKLNWLEQRRLLFATYICDRHLDHYDSITGDHC